jgi:hypothetical protein
LQRLLDTTVENIRDFTHGAVPNPVRSHRPGLPSSL